jgi:hypothetical protein
MANMDQCLPVNNKNNQIQRSMKKRTSKKTLCASILVGVLFGAMATAFAGTTNLYVEDWGSVASPGSHTLATVGWTVVAPLTGTSGGPYTGTFEASGATDLTSGNPLPVNTAYLTDLSSGTIGMIYTTDTSGAGSVGDSAFPAGGINPTLYTALTISMEVYIDPYVSNYLAVQVGGSQWYVSATPLVGYDSSYPKFQNDSLAYATATWNPLTIVDANTVTVGNTTVSTPSGNITGIGMVQVGPTWTSYPGDYNELVISASCPTCGAPPPVPVSITYPPISQTVYVGGGVSFAVQTSGTLPVTNYWYNPNGNLLTDGTASDGSFVSGSATETLTITNVHPGDAGGYSMIVSNTGPNSATNSGFTLTVNSVPSDYLYAETVPFIGPNPATVNNFLPTATIGWVSANSGYYPIFYQGGGQGAVYAYEATAMTDAYYTTATNDTGASGLPFTNINAANFPQVALEVQIEEGNGVTTDVTAYFAVQMNTNQWYVASTPMYVNPATSGWQNEELQFTTAASAWNLLTLSTTNAVIGGPASSGDTADLATGIISGVGLVFVHNGAGGDLNWYNFLVTDDVVPSAPVIGAANVPWNQTVLSGGGVSFGVAVASGAAPFTYSWNLNGSATALSNGPLTAAEGGPAVPDGAIVSGATSNILTIAGVTAAENNDTVEAFVYNDSGSDNTGNYFDIYLTVNNPPIGEIYTEAFPYVGPTGSENVPSVGWTEAAPSGYAWGLNMSGQSGGYSYGAVSAYQASAVTTAYYTSTATDTNQSGLPFPNIVLAGYTNVGAGLTLTAEIGQNAGSAGPVTAYWAVQINGSAWYIDSTPLPALTAGAAWSYPTMTFSPAKANWESITISATNASIVGPAANDLTGVMTGAGLVFVYGPGGGEDDFDNFWIGGTGVGNIDYGVTGTTLNLSWVGNPAVQLQSATSLANGGNWANVSPSTLGAYSTTVPATGGPKFYRLVGPVSAE